MSTSSDEIKMDNWPPRFHLAPRTPAGWAKFVRDLIETDAVPLDKVEETIKLAITAAYNAGLEAGNKQVDEL